MIGLIRITIILGLFFSLVVSLVPFQYLFVKARLGWQQSLPRFFHRIAAWLLGFRVKVHGDIVKERPLLLVSNHVSWSDIVVLSSVANVCFIAKSEVRKWPVFGTFAVLQRTVFVEREKKGRTAQQASDIALRLAGGDAMVLFPEGTTSDGNRVLPFKTSLFGAAHAAIRETGEEKVIVQPVSIAYTGIHGMPMGRFHRPIASWPGDVQLMPHLKGVLKEGAIDVEIRFGEPVSVTAGTSRKELARIMEERVAEMLHSSLLGRDINTSETEK
ncbi:1-acyl-sn-glycerol-3-phosphate acyltransferase [Pseudochrobactrum sp. sp1633]|uniref:lysophospholipid acyltransferase family protein n=1 Tax=Pseudochrobactrum sp. sp1633 TaxID=3036706 RepID=UPI0025A6305D|nr:1-acyl-sn-glycerol-3-phosphate acyltransferase [Pseudochrobactrum sp. sp1633]MDM8344904.1 1-acyl-sn-glycerol-3-phosphate acyltransferase [Pseudochrobactrum sp. sp1633]HWD14736.1 1-acyl-sn-glycerol-3-phosphate acyltransferase [Pseudochrobactrum sp.]